MELSVRVISGEIDSKVVATRLILPTATQPEWGAFRRVAETTSSRGRQLPAHAHQGEEVLTYVTEGFASYQFEDGPSEDLPAGSARLLTALQRTSHRVSPARGGAIRWINLVVALPRAQGAVTRLQSARPESSSTDSDFVQVHPLAGPQGPMVSVSGLECQAMLFVREGTTFPRVGRDRRALLYALAGRGSVAERTIEAGEAVLMEGLPGAAVGGTAGFRGIFATVPG